MKIIELFITSLISGFATGANMLIEIVKQKPWFLILVIFCMLMPTKKPKKH